MLTLVMECKHTQNDACIQNSYSYSMLSFRVVGTPNTIVFWVENMLLCLPVLSLTHSFKSFLCDYNAEVTNMDEYTDSQIYHTYLHTDQYNYFMLKSWYKVIISADFSMHMYPAFLKISQQHMVRQSLCVMLSGFE